MKHLHWVVPDLFPPQDIAVEVCAGLSLPALEKLLARGSRITRAPGGLEDWLCSAFGARSVAPVRAASDGLDVGTGYWLCADPVNLQLQRAQVLLVPDVIPTREEALAMCATLNEHFSGMGFTFFAPHPQRWYVQLDTEPQMATSPLRLAAWRDSRLYQPQGTDALRWQTVVTEMQMVLYAHPLNQAREARGELNISSLWLWGGGLEVSLQQSFDVAGGDSGLSEIFARQAGVARDDSLQAMLRGESEKGLWVCVAPGDAMQRGDAHAWREAAQDVERACAVPILRALQTGRLQRLTVEVPGENVAQCYELTRGDAWKLWRIAQSLARYAV